MFRTFPPPQPRLAPRIPWLILPLLVSLMFFVPRIASATIDTIYVDNTKVSDAGPGTSIANAYKRINTALTSLTGGADKVIAIVGTGVPYREPTDIEVASADSGGVGQPLVLFARGSVTVEQADTNSVWTAVPGKSTMWRAPISATVDAVSQVYLDGIPLPYVTITANANPDTLAPGRCILVTTSNPDSVYVNFGSHANWPYDVNPHGTLAHISLRKFTIRGSNVTVQGLTIRRSNDDGISVAGSAPVRNITIANCDARLSASQGFMSSTSQPHHSLTVRDNVFSENGSHGIYLPDNTTDCSILRNTCAYNREPLAYTFDPVGRSSVNGIRLGSRSGSAGPSAIAGHHLLEGNVAHHNQDTGIEIRTNNTLLRYNQSYSNQDHGFDHLSCTDNTHIGDLAWGNNRDGMSFENNSRNHTLRNCVIANNGQDRGRRDWELEFDNSALINLSSDHNVIWRDLTQESGSDSIIINVKGGSCSSDSCFKSLAVFQAAFPGLEQHSRSGQPTVTDSSGGSFNAIPLSTSSVLDGADSDVTGYLANDLRGYYRHDAQAKEPNTGTGSIDYADIGPYEFDIAETPVAPSIAVYAGRYDLLVTWNTGQYSGDEASRFDLQVGGVSFASGVSNPWGGSHCFDFGVAECHAYDVVLRINDANTTYYDLSDAVHISTKCTGSLGYVCDGEGFGGPEESLVAELQDGSQADSDEPKSLDIRIATEGSARTILYAVPRDLAGLRLDLGVYDVAGRRVMTIAQGPSRMGRFSTAINRSSPGLRQAGVYYVRMVIGERVLRKTVVLL